MHTPKDVDSVFQGLFKAVLVLRDPLYEEGIQEDPAADIGFSHAFFEVL